MSKISSILGVTVSLAVSLLLLGCGKVNTSSSNDKTLYGSGAAATTSNFSSAKAVLAQNCFTCHDWSSYTEADYSSQALIIPNSASSSRLYQKIKGNDSGTVGNMPPSGALTSDDILKIKTWINAI